MMQDPISDMATRIRNAQMADHETVSMPSSTQKVRIAEVLQRAGYIKGFTVTGDVKKELTIELKYHGGVAVIDTIQRMSRPGLRMTTACRDIPLVKNGLGIVIVSTSQGLKTDKEARALKIGGECLLKVA